MTSDVNSDRNNNKTVHVDSSISCPKYSCLSLHQLFLLPATKNEITRNLNFSCMLTSDVMSNFYYTSCASNVHSYPWYLLHSPRLSRNLIPQLFRPP